MFIEIIEMIEESKFMCCARELGEERNSILAISFLYMMFNFLIKRTTLFEFFKLLQLSQ